MSDDSIILRPQNIHELLVMANEYPLAVIYAGGTSLFPQISSGLKEIPSHTISLEHVQEMNHISRTEKYLEIGARANLEKIYSIGPPVIPDTLLKAIRETASPSIRNISSIGGIICSGKGSSSILAPLYLFDTLLEIRSLSRSRWIPISRFISEKGSIQLREKEVLTRIRIPFGEWNYQNYRKSLYNSKSRDESLSFCACIRLSKNIILDLRFAFGGVSKRPFRNREFEILFLGKKIPFRTEELNALISELQFYLSPKDEKEKPIAYQTRCALEYCRYFFEEINLGIHHIPG
ncbi:MAG: FAD binding domain-containing protein [Spirochaetales bacterium]|nr:FAD binding domain-containing protein [Spirochaetales bacterium]